MQVSKTAPEKKLRREIPTKTGRIEMISAEGKRDTKFLTLKNGLRLIVKRKGELPLVSVSLAMPGGLRAENRDTSGLSNLASSMVLKGTKKRKESEIVPAIERMGGSIGMFSGMNSMGLTMSLMSKDLDDGLDIFEDMVLNSVFPKEELAKQKKKIIATIKEQEDDIFEKGMIEVKYQKKLSEF